MDWQLLFLSPEGRISRQPFWIGFAILFVGGFVLQFIPVIGQFIGMLLIYPWVCLYSKRLHDMGKSGWLQLIPFGVLILATVIAVAVGGAGMLAAMAGGQNDPAAMSAIAGSLGMAGLVFLLAALVCLGFLLWIGLTPGEPGPNQYGESPKDPASAPAPTA